MIVRRCESPIVGLQRRTISWLGRSHTESEDAKARLWDCNYLLNLSRLYRLDVRRCESPIVGLQLSGPLRSPSINEVRRCESPIVGLQHDALLHERLSDIQSQKMRKPDCGIAT